MGHDSTVAFCLESYFSFANVLRENSNRRSMNVEIKWLAHSLLTEPESASPSVVMQAARWPGLAGCGISVTIPEARARIN